MNFLAPLYVAGILAVAGPILFHLIRRTPRGRQQFSSLMFLRTSPHRVTRRSRLDHLLLLFLRATVVTLLALAFTRPLIRGSVGKSILNPPALRMAILVDTSASMRRDDLWEQTKDRIDNIVAELSPQDQVGLFGFDRRLRPIVELRADSADPNRNDRQRVRRALSELTPGWGGTDLGAALTEVADILETTRTSDDANAQLRMLLVSDLQEGSRMDSLQAYAWPEDIQLQIIAIQPRDPTNAALQILAEDSASAANDGLRVRVSNFEDSTIDQFRIHWSSQHAVRSAGQDVYLPPGTRQIVHIPFPADQDHGVMTVDRVVLSGDAATFDNTRFVVPARKNRVKIGYLGQDAADDPQGLRYYLELAWSQDGRRDVTIETLSHADSLRSDPEKRPQLVVASEADANVPPDRLEDYVKAGGTLLLVPKGDEAVSSLLSHFKVMAVGTKAQSAPEPQYAMLGHIDFRHPVFSAFAQSQYRDFTKIRFWKYRRVAFEPTADTRVLARFDSGDPALWEQSMDQGRLFVLTSGWHPNDSQLALSSKFVPLMGGILDLALGNADAIPQYTVYDHVPLPNRVAAELSVRKPDGTEWKAAEGVRVFTHTDQPGVYEVRGGARTNRFTVNLATSESETTPLDVDKLEQLGVQVGRRRPQREVPAQQIRLNDIQTESRQQIWRWMIVAALGVLFLETWYGGRMARAARNETELN